MYEEGAGVPKPKFVSINRLNLVHWGHVMANV